MFSVSALRNLIQGKLPLRLGNDVLEVGALINSVKFRPPPEQVRPFYIFRPSLEQDFNLQVHGLFYLPFVLSFFLT